MATHRVQQLDINLARVQDEGAREALTSIVRFVNELTQSFRTNKEARAESFVNNGDSAGFDKDGVFWAESLEVASGGQFKVKVYQGSIALSASYDVELTPGAKVLGVFGWSQINATSVWTPIAEQSVALADSIYIDSADSGALRLTNGDVNSTNEYRLVVFYVDR